jgi:hypothetical protein
MANAASERSIKTVAGGSTIEAIGGIGAVILAILGLAQIRPLMMASIATILVGASLVIGGAAVAARFSDVARPEGTRSKESTQLGAGLSAELLGGIAGVVLGVLALIGTSPMVLIPVSVIIFGAALIIGTATSARLDDLGAGYRGGRAGDAGHKAVSAATGAQVLVGIAAVVLGALALFEISPLVLSLAALLAVGATILLHGSAVGGKLMGAIQH